MEILKNLKDKEVRSRWGREIRSMALIIVGVLAFRSTFFEPFKIPSGSLIPTLMIGDFILVNKFSYGFKVPFSDWYTDPVYLTPFKSPKRGDIVVFKYPRNPDINYIKRVVGVPGDTLELRNKILYVNGEAQQQIPAQGGLHLGHMVDKYKHSDFEFFKTQSGDIEHLILQNKYVYLFAGFPPTVVPEGQYFVMGDNRDASSDSRDWGFVPQENIKGKAIVVWFSMVLFNSDYPFAFNPARIGTRIH